MELAANRFAVSLLFATCYNCIFVDERVDVQRKSFTRWANRQLARASPPSVIDDLFDDLRDGTHLLELLQVLSGQQLVSDVFALQQNNLDDCVSGITLSHYVTMLFGFGRLRCMLVWC